MSFTIWEFVLLLLIAGICGGVAQAIAGFSRGGCLVSIALGFIGALVGTWLAKTLEFPEIFVLRIGEMEFPVVWTIIGATIFVAFVGLLTRRPPPRD